jgi:hypothetical protein
MSQRSLNSHENKEFFDLMLKTKFLYRVSKRDAAKFQNSPPPTSQNRFFSPCQDFCQEFLALFEKPVRLFFQFFKKSIL